VRLALVPISASSSSVAVMADSIDRSKLGWEEAKPSVSVLSGKSD
jgi:hypothetical protein